MIDFLNKRILVFAAHPDDELLGLGGTLNRLIKEFRCSVKVVILGEGITSRADQRDPEKWEKELERHNQNILDAQKKIGYQFLKTYNFPDNRFDSVPLLDIIKVVEKEKSDFKPDLIFTHHGSDLNVDHQRTFEAVLTAIRPMEHETTGTLICFETPSSTEWQAHNYANPFLPNFFVGLDESNINTKTEAMQCYFYESREFPHPRSPEALISRSKHWGSVCGSSFAEAFMLIRSILK